MSTSGENGSASDLRALSRAVEAVLLVADRPVTGAALSAATGASDERAVREAVTSLNAEYEREGRSFRVEHVAGGYRLMTLARYAPVLAAYHGGRESSRLSRAAIETLAVIAYRQPITRAELEAVRGVACGEVLRSLLDRRLIDVVGRAEELGRPMLYGTTRRFLDAFGLATLKDLPTVEELAPAPPPA